MYQQKTNKHNLFNQNVPPSPRRVNQNVSRPKMGPVGQNVPPSPRRVNEMILEENIVL